MHNMREKLIANVNKEYLEREHIPSESMENDLRYWDEVGENSSAGQAAYDAANLVAPDSISDSEQVDREENNGFPVFNIDESIKELTTVRFNSGIVIEDKSEPELVTRVSYDEHPVSSNAQNHSLNEEMQTNVGHEDVINGEVCF
jgi:hypothetical protein